jgi:C4-dicarboxylate-specific signal transduction histidine kinase
MKARRKDGTLIDVEMRAVPVMYRGAPHALGMARDITAQKRAEAERARLEGQLLQAKKLEAIGTLAGGIAHDFNNILSAALGYGEMAQKEAPAGTPLKRHVEAVMSAALRAKSLVARILAFSRSGMGERVPVHVQSVVGEALDLVAASLPAHVRLERALEAGNAAVLGDATQIHQVVMNLCANGAQAMKAPGTLSVSLDVVERGAGETILLVDDEEPLVRLGEEMLASLGYEPVGFTSSAAALEAFRATPERFHAVLSDETMPEMTGCELAKAIRALRPEIPIVLMSGFVSPALTARARELAIVDVLSKPLVERDIARGLDAALKREAKVAA